MSFIDVPTVGPAPAVDWASVTQRLGTSLPNDYQSWCRNSGAIEINEFLAILHPGESNPTWNLEHKIIDQARHIRTARQRITDLSVYDTFPAPGGLLLWGQTVNADSCFWKTDGEPDRWTVVIWSEIHEAWEYDLGFKDFITGILNEDFVCPGFSDEFPTAYPGEPIVARRVARR